MSERSIIERGGRRFVLVPEETYERMIDDLDDIRAYDRAKREPQEWVPAEIVDRLLAGENRIRVWRAHRGLTQQALADKARISKPYLSQLESGQRVPSLAVLRALAAALGLEIEDIAPRQRSRPRGRSIAARRRRRQSGHPAK